jgi:hypothetical protein
MMEKQDKEQEKFRREERLMLSAVYEVMLTTTPCPAMYYSQGWAAMASQCVVSNLVI